MNKLHLLLLLALSIILLPSCSVNPVTGKQELAWMSEAWELNTGKKYYGFQQQSGGGQYTIDPDLTRYVSSVGKKLSMFSSRSHLPYEFVVLNDSTPNAWALPGGKIAINRGLLVELQDEAELAAVLAHEIVHADARHSAQSQEVGTLLSAGQMAASVFLAQSKYNNALSQQGVALTGLYGQTRYSRSRELESDLYGMRYMREAGYDPQAAVSLQQTFVRLSEGRKSDFFSTLFASHPPSLARVNANKTTASQLTPGGIRGRERYQQEMAKLLKRKPAYDLSDQAVKAIAAKDYRKALSLSDQAIQKESKESRFHEVKSVALTKLNRAQDALKALDKAVSLDPNYFSPVLRRGILKHSLKSYSAATQDLQASLKLAPTEVAYQKLGEIAEASQGCKQALGYYQKAFQVGGGQNPQLKNKLAALQLTCQ